jgi:hypothetical protein
VAVEVTMRRVIRGHRTFWIGTLKRRDCPELGIVVHDPLTRAATGAGYVVLYEAAEAKCGDFRKEVVKTQVGSANSLSAAEIEGAIDAYCRFAGIDIEAERCEFETTRRAIVEAHDHFLADRRLPPAATRPASGEKRRVAHCYVCGRSLDNSVDLECAACGWIVCRCGACGCAYDAAGD